jgi:hypothetical protein
LIKREIRVPRGCPNDNVLVFKNEGNQKAGYQNSEIKRRFMSKSKGDLIIGLEKKRS